MHREWNTGDRIHVLSGFTIGACTLASENDDTFADYAAKQGVAQSVMSRHIQDIGPRNRYGSGEGFNLIEQDINPVDPRNREVHLTQKGKGLYNAIRQAVAPFHKRRAPR